MRVQKLDETIFPPIDQLPSESMAWSNTD